MQTLTQIRKNKHKIKHTNKNISPKNHKQQTSYIQKYEKIHTEIKTFKKHTQNYIKNTQKRTYTCKYTQK